MKNIKSNRGFTLIELLAVIIILAVIMTVAIPNIVGTLEKNKKDSFIKDAKRVISSCKYTIKSEKKYEYPDANTLVVFPLTEIKNLDLNVSSYDTYYSQTDSFCAITKDKVGSDYEYTYYVHLVSCTDKECENLEDNSSLKNRGINLTYESSLNNSSRYDLLVRGDDVSLNFLKDNSYSDLISEIVELRVDNSENDINTSSDVSASISNVVVYKTNNDE